MKQIFILFGLFFIFSCTEQKKFDTIIRNGTIYDGSGKEGFTGDIGINGDTIAFIGDLKNASAQNEIDAKGLAVAPGFINMLSWATESLIQDGNSQSDIRQGVTLEVMGEGWSMGPWTTAMKKQLKEAQTDIRYDIEWSTLGEYLSYLEKKRCELQCGLFCWRHHHQGSCDRGRQQATHSCRAGQHAPACSTGYGRRRPGCGHFPHLSTRFFCQN